MYEVSVTNYLIVQMNVHRTAPIGVWVLTERPSMPPGDQIEELGDLAFERGKIDYVWILWDKRRCPHATNVGQPFVPTFWIPPRSAEAAPWAVRAK